MQLELHNLGSNGRKNEEEEEQEQEQEDEEAGP